MIKEYKFVKNGVLAMMELLSPAGSMDALRAAVQCGADAVYLGCGAFNARANAKNFTLEELAEAVRYCHIRGCAVHLTVNTLTTDRERSAVAALIDGAAEAGVDAFIVQDPGTVRLCRALAPDTAVHASTQMGVHSLDGVLHAADMGCSRAVLARELSREEIAAICAKSPIEIEVFAHGALCMCYSGQCYFSAVVGQRSGNRGQCAQPCRLPYGYGKQEERFPLSLKDNCLIAELEELRAMGVASLKLEGRMKRPEYVATVTRIYREALDKRRVTPENGRELEQIFSRQGFTQGYYNGKTGREMLGTRQDIRNDRDLLARARSTYENGEASRVGLQFAVQMQEKAPVRLTVTDPQGRECTVTGPVPENARSRALTEDELRSRLAKTGGTPYALSEFSAVTDAGLTLPVSAVNALRRDALAQMDLLRGAVQPHRKGAVPTEEKRSLPQSAPVITVSVFRAAQITEEVKRFAPAVLYVPLSELLAHPECAEGLSPVTELCVTLPRVIREPEQKTIENHLVKAKASGAKSALCGNLGHIAMVHRAGLAVRGDFGLNLYSSAAADYWAKQALTSATVSFEATLPQIRDLRKPMPLEAIIYGRLQLMLTENCAIRNRTGACACQNGQTVLVDRRGEEFPVLPDPGTCRSVILNGKILWLLDKKDALSGLGLWALRLAFTTETPREIARVLDAAKNGGAFDPAVCTRGLYQRGVE